MIKDLEKSLDSGTDLIGMDGKEVHGGRRQILSVWKAGLLWEGN